MQDGHSSALPQLSRRGHPCTGPVRPVRPNVTAQNALSPCGIRPVAQAAKLAEKEAKKAKAAAKAAAQAAKAAASAAGNEKKANKKAEAEAKKVRLRAFLLATCQTVGASSEAHGWGLISGSDCMVILSGICFLLLS